MKTDFDKIFETIQSIFDFNIIRRMFFLGSIAVSVALGITLYGWIQEPVYRPLNFKVNDQNISAIIETLERENIPFKFDERNGIVLVPLSDVSMAKLKLSSAGISQDDSSSFSYLSNPSQLGSSHFLEKARYIRALETDLAKTISSIQNISGAKVHIAVPQNNIFMDEKAKKTASVVINLTPGHQDDKEKIQAIIQLVAASVPELDPANVAITDQYGHYLTGAFNPESLLNQEQLAYQDKIQQYYERKIQTLITPILGTNKASVSVNADIDFTQQEQTKEAYDPDQSVLRSEQTIQDSSTSSGSSSGVPGALANQPPSGSGNSGNQNGSSGSDSHKEDTKNYEISKSTAYIKSSSPKINHISVAVVLDNEVVYDEKTKKETSKPLDKAKIDKITALLKSAIGFNEKRGDQVTVINSGFVIEKMEEKIEPPFWQEPWFWDYVKRILGITIGSIFLFIMYRKLSNEFKGNKDKKTDTKLITNSTHGLVTPEMILLKNEQINILKELAAKDPNKVASIIKKWVSK